MTFANTFNVRKIADSLGIISSATCAAHCLLLPALLVAGSSFPSFLVDENTFHVLLTFVVIPCALIAFFIGCRKHKDKWVVVLGSTGVATMIFTAVAGHDLLGEFWERVSMAIASALLICAHARNYSLCKDSGCQH